MPRTEGKTPAFVDVEVQKLLDAVETSTHTGLRDRALLGVLAYTFECEEQPRGSVFYKNKTGDIFYTYSSYGRGTDL